MGENLSHYHEKVRYVAYHDSLTKLPNRLSIVKKFFEMKKEADAKEQQMAVIYMDGDNFKQVNDQKIAPY